MSEDPIVSGKQRPTVTTYRLAVLALVWAGLIFGTSSSVVTVRQLASTVSIAAGGHVSETSFRHFWGVFWWLFVKGWHAIEFGILYSLIRLAIPGTRWLPLVLAGLYAVSDEAHQIFVPDRGCRASDVCIDWLGILAAWWLWRTFRGGNRRPWLTLLAGSVWVAAVYFLSVVPFGLVKLPNGDGKPPSQIGP